MYAQPVKNQIKILLVDDDEGDYYLTRELLVRHQLHGPYPDNIKFSLEWVHNYDDALHNIISQQHDIYLIDYYLEKRTGLDLLKEAIRHGCRAPMIIITNDADRSLDIQAMQAGAVDFLIKGELNELLLERTIRYAITQARHFTEQEKALVREQGLNNLTMMLTAPSLDSVLEEVIKVIVELVGAQGGYIGLLDANKGNLFFKYAYNPPVLADIERILPRSNSISWHSIDRREPILVNVIEYPQILGHLMVAGARQLLSSPIISGDTTFGVLSIWNTFSGEEFGPRDIDLVKAIARQVGIAMQNTARFKDLEQHATELLSAKENWEATFDAVTDLLIVTDKEERILQWNYAAQRSFQIDAGDQGRFLGQILFGQNKPLNLNRILGEVFFPNLPGRYLLVPFPIIHKDLPQGFVFVIRDITEKKEMETALLGSQKLADLGTLAAGIAHELNSPLQVITGVGDDLIEQLKNNQPIDRQKYQNALEMIVRNGWRSAEIVRSLLLYARPTTEEYDYYDINQIVQDTLLLIEHQLKHWSNITIIKDFSPAIPVLYCDRNQIIQLIINLLTNARDAIDYRGTITIKTAYDTDRKRVFLGVQDSGIGIPEENLHQIFTPFFTTKQIGRGTGLGLAIVRGVVQAHNGHIDVNTTDGEGTSFSIFFPIVAPRNEKENSDQKYSMNSQVERVTKGRFD